MFNYVVTPTAPTISAVSPPKGPVAGGNVVIVRGTNLRGSDTNIATVTIDGKAATVTAISSQNTALTVTVPAGVAGEVDVVAQTSDGRATLLDGYEYGVDPTIASVTPASGPIAGGTRVAIAGTNFGFAGTPEVTVGGAAAICVERLSNDLLTAVVPAGVLGARDVSITPDTGGGTVTSAGGFSYITPTANPTISSIDPAQGTSAGGTSITINGTNLGSGSATTVLINGKCATDIAASATSLTATTPAGTIGYASVQISTPTGSVTAASGDQRFRYVDIASVTPGSGPTTGGTVATIVGSGFGSNPTVTVGGETATVNSATDTSINITVPPGATGNANVVVTPQGQAALTRSNGFRLRGPDDHIVHAERHPDRRRRHDHHHRFRIR